MVVNFLTQICSIHWFFSSFGVTSELLELWPPNFPSRRPLPKRNISNQRKCPVVATQTFFIFTQILGEMIQFDQHIVQMGWFNHQVENARQWKQLKPRDIHP